MMIVTQANLEITVWTEQPPESPASELPVRLRINGVDFFGVGRSIDPKDPTDDNYWIHEDPLFFALEGLISVQLTRKLGRYVEYVDEYAHHLLFQMVDHDVAIASTMRMTAGRVPFHACLQAYEELYARVTSYILALFPDFPNSPDWQWKHDPERLQIYYEDRMKDSYLRTLFDFDRFGHLFAAIK
jgi:hypothetical protein